MQLGVRAMTGVRRIAFTVPDSLLQELEHLVALERSSRSVLICEAVQRYVAERKRREMRRQLRFGYRSMGPVNLALAEEGPVFEQRFAPQARRAEGS